MAFDVLSFVMGQKAAGGSSGGGGSIAPGVYWETLAIPNVGANEQCWFTFNGELYALYGNTTTNAYTTSIYHYINNKWTSKVSGFQWTISPIAFQIFEYNGKIHLCGAETKYHYIFDGSSVSTAADLPNKAAYVAMFEQNGLLKYYSFYDGNVYVWDETNDTWTSEATPGSEYDYVSFFNVNGTIYARRSKKYYTYDGTELTEIGTTEDFSKTLQIGNDVYYTVAKGTSGYSYLVKKINFITGEVTSFSYAPYCDNKSTLFEYNGKPYVLPFVSTRCYMPITPVVVAE